MDDVITNINQITEDNIYDVVEDFLFSFDDNDEPIMPESERSKNIGKIQKLAAKWHIKKDFDAYLKRVEKDFNNKLNEVQKNKYSSQGIRCQEFSGSKYPALKCGDWIADDSGIYRFSNGSIVRASYTPITITALCENIETGEQKVEFAFKKGNSWKTITDKRSIIAKASSITQLVDSGLDVSSETAKNLVKYLQDIIGLNIDTIDKKQSTSKLGWRKVDDELIFMPFDENLIFDGADRYPQMYDSIKSKGSFEKWQELVRSIRSSGRIEPKIMLASSLASILVEKMGCLPFVTYLYGRTGGGKTVCLMLAASVWANPSIYGGFFGDWDTTKSAIEARENALNNLPMLMDDAAKVNKTNAELSSYIYMMASGKGKERSNTSLGLRNQNTWCNCVITNGEHPIIKETDQGGAVNRVIEVPTGNDDIFSDGHGVVEVLKENYGHAGRRFIELLKEKGVTDERIKERYESFLSKLTTGTDVTQKQAFSAAVILTAEFFASFVDLWMYGYPGHEDDIDIREMIKILKTDNDVSEGVRCYEYFLDVVERYRSRFKGDESYPETWGEITKNNDVIILPTILADICKEKGFDKKMFLNWCEANNLCEHTDTEHHRSQRVLGNARKWCHVIKIREIDGKNGEIHHDENL